MGGPNGSAAQTGVIELKLARGPSTPCHRLAVAPISPRSPLLFRVTVVLSRFRSAQIKGGPKTGRGQDLGLVAPETRGLATPPPRHFFFKAG